MLCKLLWLTLIIDDNGNYGSCVSQMPRYYELEEFVFMADPNGQGYT